MLRTLRSAELRASGSHCPAGLATRFSRAGFGARLLAALLLSLACAASANPPEQSAGQLFNAAQVDWAHQRWDAAIAKYKQAAERFPSDPMGVEARSHYAFSLSFVTAPEVAIAEYEKVISIAPGSHEAHEAKVGIAALKYWLGEYREGYKLAGEVLQETTDWATIKECVGFMKQVGRLIELQKHGLGQSAKDCGPRTLGELANIRGIQIAEAELDALLPIGDDGVSMDQLASAASSRGMDLVGVRLDAADLEATPTPFIAHLRNNHYVVVTKASKGRVDFIDPHSGKSYGTAARFSVLWDGAALIPADAATPKLHPRHLDKSAMENIFGGHHLHGRNTGSPEENPTTEYEEDPSSCPAPGLPRWLINLSNFNLIVQDTDFTYSGKGPRVEVTRTYNSDSSQESAFGRSWTFNYHVSLSQNPDGADITRESGKVDHFVSRGDGTFTPPLSVHDKLTKNLTDGTFVLKVKRTRLTQRFDAQGRLTSITDANGNAVTLQYDSTSRLQSVTDAAGRISRFLYNATGHISEVVDPLGRRATFSYDASNNMVQSVDMVGNVATFSYDANSYMTAYTTPRGTTQIRYGTTPHFTEFPFVVKEVVDPVGNTTQFDTDCCIAWVIDARGNKTFYFNNVNAETTEITDPLGNKTQREFVSGNLTRFTDANGHATAFTYDTRGNLTRVTDPLGNRTQFQYDGRDNVTSVTDPLGRVTAFIYNSTDNLTRITDAKAGVTSFVYNTAGQPTSLTDARNSVTKFSHDTKGNLTKVTNPVGGVTSRTYDLVGRLATLTDPTKKTFTYTFDGIDRLTGVRLPDGTTKAYSHACCSLSGIADPSGTLSFERDAGNRLTRFVNTFNQAIRYGYDGNRNLSSLTYPDGKNVQYEYDAANRLSKVTDWLGNITRYEYDRAGNLFRTLNANGTIAAYEYDAADRLVKLINIGADGSTISRYSYGLDAAGNRINIASVDPVALSLASTNVTSAYDADNRIQSATGATFTHDANGNLTGIGGTKPTTFSFDASNRLTGVTFAGYSAQHQYDGGGNRIARTVNGTATRYVVDPNASLSRLLAETDAAGNSNALYVYGRGLISRSSPNGQTHVYHYDGIGSATALTDSAGTVVNKYAYEPFGKLSSNSVEAVPNPFHYVGLFGVADEGDGLLFMRARHYSLSLGRFVNKDPAGLAAGLNLFRYVGNNPITRIDPLGLGSDTGCSASTEPPVVDQKSIDEALKSVNRGVKDAPGFGNNPWGHCAWCTPSP